MKRYLLGLGALVLTTGSLSCMKTPDLEDKSVPATAQEVTTALANGWGTVSPLTMLKGDFIYQETDQQIDTMDPRVVLQEGTTISNITETATEYDYTFLYQTAVVSGNNSSQSTREDHRTVTKGSSSDDSTENAPTPATTPAVPVESAALSVAKKNLKALKTNNVSVMADDLQMTLGFERLIMLANSCVMSEDLQNYCINTLKVDSCEIKCSNLKSETEVRAAPDLIKQQANCGGLKDCKLNVKKVTFDWAILLHTGGNVEKQKVTYSLAISPDLPFLPRVLDYCSRGLVTVSSASTKVLVTVCNRLKNFQRTSN